MDSSIDSQPQETITPGEKNLFIAGCCMLVLWISASAALWRLECSVWLDILTMGFGVFFLGRAAAIAQATQIEMNRVLIIFLATYVDVLTTFILYPLLVVSYRSLFERPFFHKHVKPLFDAASKRVDRFSHFKVAGVFLFVWFPFWGTGVLVGALLGYLLGLRLWLNMATVAVGTLTAIVCWVFAYDRLFKWLGGIHESIPLAATIALIAALVGWRLIHRIRNGRRNKRGRTVP